MEYNFFEIIGVNIDCSEEEIVEALHKKLKTLEDNKDVKLWNYLLRFARELRLNFEVVDTNQDVIPEFYDILGVDSKISKRELMNILNEKYKELEASGDIRLWNFLHREASKLGIEEIPRVSDSLDSSKIYSLLNLPNTASDEEVEAAFVEAWNSARNLPENNKNAEYIIGLYTTYNQYLRYTKSKDSDAKGL